MNDGYDVDVPIGTGAMATVFRARQRSVNRVVALKRLRVADADMVERLRHEAAVLATLDHPNIVRVHDVVADGAGVAIAMQYAAGGSLADRLRQGGPMTPDAVAAMGAAIADALACAHANGVLHRDVKPANILFTADGRPLLSDFGVARHVGSAPTDVAGTVEYLDPAVVGGAPPDARADIYGLARACRDALGDDLGGLRAAIERATHPDPASRFESAAAFASALRDVAAPADRGTQTFGPRPPARRPLPPAHRRRRVRVTSVVRALGAVSAVAVLAVLALLLLVTGDRGHTPRPRPGAVAPAVAFVPPAPPPAQPRAQPPAAWTWSGGVLTIGDRRWRLGRPGDVVVLGDWDCNGAASPALYRPASGQVFLFDGYASAGAETSRPAIDSGRRNGEPVVTRAGNCDRVEVRERA